MDSVTSEGGILQLEIFHDAGGGRDPAIDVGQMEEELCKIWAMF